MAKKQTAEKNNDPQGWESIRKKVKDTKAEILILNVAIIILGILMIAMPEQFSQFMAQIIGVGLIVWGFLRCISFVRLKNEEMFGSYALVQGTAMLGFGVFFLTQPDKFNNLLNLILSLGILVIAVLKVQNAINYLKLKISKWWLHLLSAVIIMAFGIVAIVKPGNIAENVALIITGCAFVISGIWDNVSVMIMSKFIKKTAKALENGSHYVDVEAKDDNDKKNNKKKKSKNNEETKNFDDDGFDDLDYGDGL